MSQAQCSWTIPIGADETMATWDPPAGPPRGAVFLCAHGAGGHMDDRSMLAIRDACIARGLGMVRFNFLYRAKGSGRPDAMPRLLDCFRAVIARVREELDPATFIIGGRSMGGRAASMLMAEQSPADALLLLAYPLHPPGETGKLRDGHLPGIRCPVLCCNGTRDNFCERELMEQVLERVGPNWQMRWLEGADHGFHVLKRFGRTDLEVLTEVGDHIAAWASRLPAAETS